MHPHFTPRAQKSLVLANEQARRFCHDHIAPEHILLGLLEEGTGTAMNVLVNLQVDRRLLRVELEKRMQPGPELICPEQLPQTQASKQVIEYAVKEAHDLLHNYVGTEHLLLGLLRIEETSASSVLKEAGLSCENARDELKRLLE